MGFSLNQESLRSVADRFDVTRSCAYRVYRRICKAIAVHLSQRFIQFPSGARAREESEKFEETRGFPGVMGAIDGCHIPIKAPGKNPEQYINRKGHHSIQLQVICDTSMRFTDVFCGFPGSVHTMPACFEILPSLWMLRKIPSNCSQAILTLLRMLGIH